MSDKKISELPVGIAPLNSTDEFVIRRADTNLRVSVLELQRTLFDSTFLDRVLVDKDCHIIIDANGNIVLSGAL